MLLVVLTALLGLAGCEQPEDITTYKIPKRVPEQLLPGKERMLAVMVPRGNQVWFFKVMGPEDSVGTIDEKFRSFVTDVQFDDSENPELTDLPENWQRGGSKPFRFASIDINTPGKQLDLSVSSLSKPDNMEDSTWNDYVVQNVNRWRGQVGLDPSEEKWAGGEPIEIAASDGPSVWVDLTGQPGQSSTPPMSMNAPFMNAGGGMPPMSTPRTSPQPAAGDRVTFDSPEGWRKKSAGGMRLVSIDVGPEDSPAEVTVIQAGGDLRSNVARWMGQVLGNPPEEAAVDAMMDGAEKIDVSGRAANRFIITGQDDAKISIDATIVPLEGGQSMFIKMTGPPQVVDEQQEQMGTFLKSLSF